MSNNGDKWAAHGHPGEPCSPPEAVRGVAACRNRADTPTPDEQACLATTDAYAQMFKEADTPTPELVTPPCVHCKAPEGEHGDQGACLRAGFYGNRYAPERVTLTDGERDAIHHAGDIHHPDHCDCSAYVVEAGFQEDDCCVGLLDTFDAVEGILAAREQALREEIAGEIEALTLLTGGEEGRLYDAYRFDDDGVAHRDAAERAVERLRDDAARIVRGGAR